ncbi:MAG: SpoIID/LytB domain-containing protein [Betaproteobacteria bacterium]
MKIIILFVCLASFAPPAYGSENIRVALADNQKNVVLKSPSGLVIEGQSFGHEEKKLVFRAETVGIRPLRVRASGEFIQVNGSRYRGWIELRKKRNGLLLIINDLDIEDYLQGVVASEIPHGWEIEALKAQAVAARTYALYQKRTAGRKPYHISATVNSQVYAGSKGERPRAAEAVRDTKGIVLFFEGKMIPAFYHSSCGGHTEDAYELWGIDAPYLKGVDCECQEISRYGVWEKKISKMQVVRALRQRGYRVSDILGMSIEGITPAGRVKDVAIQSPRGKTFVPAESLRAALGNTLIPSVFFELEFEGKEAVFSGRGMGHGVGLCQWGAEEMAEKGYDFKAILSHYYPGTNFTRLP